MKVKVRDYDPRLGDFLQGDICIFPIPEHIELSPSAVEIQPIDGRLIIQEGETTGHHHAIALPRTRNFRTSGKIDPILDVSDTRLRHAFGGAGNAAEVIGTARLFQDPSAIAALAACRELTRTDLAIAVLIVEQAPVVIGHEEHDGGRLPHAWTDAAGNARRGRYYVGRQIESAGAEERVVLD